MGNLYYIYHAYPRRVDDKEGKVAILPYAL
jgi:hypothetical protein